MLGLMGKEGFKHKCWEPPQGWNIVNKNLFLPALISESFTKVPCGRTPVCLVTVSYKGLSININQNHQQNVFSEGCQGRLNDGMIRLWTRGQNIHINTWLPGQSNHHLCHSTHYSHTSTFCLKAWPHLMLMCQQPTRSLAL